MLISIPRIGKNKNVWLGVSAGKVSDRKKVAWWCVSKSGSIGDLLLIYQKMFGIARIEKIISESPVSEYRCSDLGLRTVRTRLVLTLGRPISAKKLRLDPILRELSVVRRNFQATTFQIPIEAWPHLAELIKGHCRKSDYDNMKLLNQKGDGRKKRRDTNLKKGNDTDLDFYL